ncbi:helix-turn-helix transcriptional regulator [Roseibium alexandrii]|uniref:Virulence-regulating protein VirS n=1 Tax=Roseibium alexandrii TaxID=388408 RepID=A0A0M7AAJ1_9HYPH|nr:AraC family transcriptional regulator [Roseibium alexandrii]CTQ72128.1 Virulence-regulating protein VirS [Roseibium alexandrii]
MTTAYSGLVSNLLQGYAEAGYSQSDALTAAKLECLSDAPTAQDFIRLSRAISLQMNDEFAGQLERPQRIGTLALMAEHASRGRTVGDAFSRLADFMNMLDNTFTVTFSTAGSECRFQLERTTPAFPKSEFGIEAILVLMHRLTGWLAGKWVPLSSVWFDYPRPAWASGCGELFPGARPSFSFENSGFSMPIDVQSWPLHRSAEAAVAWARRTPMDAFMPVALLQGVSQQVAGLIEAAIIDKRPLPSMDELASLLEMPVYTLRRRLKKEGVSLPDIRLQVKRDHARSMLAETGESIEAIALRLGFSETSAFIRAFKEWTGVTPRTYRQSGRLQVPVPGHRTFR